MSKFLDYNKAVYGIREKLAVLKSLNGNWLSNGFATLKFEDDFAKWWGVKYALSTNSGSTANLVALQALDLPKGSEVITPAGGAFPTTIAPLTYLGLVPVFVDVKGLTIDPDEVEKAISSKTKVILFAHTLGQMPDMERMVKIAKKHNLKIVEDCCDAVGSSQNGVRAGTFGEAATVSFYPAHHMTTGEGGMLLTNSNKIYLAAKSIRDWGRDCICRVDRPNPVCKDRFKNPPFDHRYYYTRIGLNFKMSEMQAAFGLVQLKRLDKFIEIRRRNYAILAGRLHKDFDKEISPFAYPLFSKDRQKALTVLTAAGIGSRTIFSGNILRHPAYKNINCRIIGKLPNSDKMFNEGYFVGVGPNLSVEDMNYIADKIIDVKLGEMD
jgi:CDP-6-deoxy-D-xylo-4-hexulose-3-dehydrase